MSIPFVAPDEPRYGEAVAVAPLIRRVVARNPSKFTAHGTGTYVVGLDRPGAPVAVIDPGPDLAEHRAALDRAVDGQHVVAVLVTHCHADHSPLATPFARDHGAPTVGFGPHPRLDDPDADDPVIGDPPDGDEPVRIEESTDFDFDPDRCVVDGEVVAGAAGWTLTAVHTPGHTSNHLCFALDERRDLFTGDHVMGWSTTVIGPPDGDMRAYLDSLEKLRRRDDAVYWPTHGAPVADPRPFLDAFIAHRVEREAQVLAAVRGGHHAVDTIVALLYADVRAELHKPAGRSVLAHLIKLVDDGAVSFDGTPTPSLTSAYRPA